MKKKISLSVIEFSIPSPLTGSIDTYSGFNQGPTFGIQIHQEIQQQRSKDHPCYEAEVWTAHQFKCGKYIFDVSGIMDGIFNDEHIKIEEIKTAFDLKKLLHFVKNNEDHPYSLQLKTYGYIFWLKTNKIPALNLHLVSSRNKKHIDFPITLDIEKYETWLSSRLKELVQTVKTTEKSIRQRKTVAQSLDFPFSSARPGQKELIACLQSGVTNNNRMLIQAPTGLGKTIGVLFPTLVEALNRGQKVVYLTPKNSQHMVAQSAIKSMQTNGGKIKSLMLTAKRKICMKQEPMCNAEYCEFAENHYTKVSENNLLTKLKKQKRLTFYSFKKMAAEYKVCPYELQMDMIPHVEVVICDYNYVFSPRSSGTRVSKLRLGETEKSNLIIDELHNLPSRAMDYFSPGLSVVFFEKIILLIEKIPSEFQNKFLELLHDCIEIIQSCEVPEKKGPQLISPPSKSFTEHEKKLQDFLATYLESDVVIGPEDLVLNVCNYWAEFTTALEWTTLDRSEFFTTYYPHPPSIKITCCDASELIKVCYDQFKQIIGFSATLKPFDYYSQLTGVHSKKLKTKEFFSPFPQARRKLLIIPQISSRYSNRSRNYPRIVEVISKISVLKPGNYFAFFPSFEFLERVLKLFKPIQGFKVLAQNRGMKQEEVRNFLNALTENNHSNIIFAVQGGIFSEGMDYPGNLAIGAFVIGTPLPNYDWEREKMKEYYQSTYGKGEEYAYIYPAMAKSIQAAGRVIRSESDKGIIILMDDRFLHPSYYQCMPKDWFEKEPTEMVSTAILDDIREFWARDENV